MPRSKIMLQLPIRLARSLDLRLASLNQLRNSTDSLHFTYPFTVDPRSSPDVVVWWRRRVLPPSVANLKLYQTTMYYL